MDGGVLDFIRRHGGEGILNPADVPELTAANLRVFNLLKDMEWHSATEIRRVAGNGIVEASEGLRRARDLRPLLEMMGMYLDKTRMEGTRLWYYRFAKSVFTTVEDL